MQRLRHELPVVRALQQGVPLGAQAVTDELHEGVAGPIRAGVVLRLVDGQEQRKPYLQLRLFLDMVDGERIVADQDLDSPLLVLSPHVSEVRAEFPSTISGSVASRSVADGIQKLMERVTAERVAEELIGAPDLSASDLNPLRRHVAGLFEALGPDRWESLIATLARRGISVDQQELEGLPFAVDVDYHG